MGAVVIYKVWTLTIELQLLVVPSGVYKWSINPISNPYPVYSHTPKYVTIFCVLARYLKTRRLKNTKL
jgi:hypothetical protein